MNILTNDNSDNESFIDPYNFPKNESKEARTKRETAFLKLLTEGQEKAQKKHPFDIAIPESWLDYLSPEYRTSWTHAIDKHIVYLSFCLSDPQTIVDKMNSIGQLAMLSFATGAKHTLQLFHNVTNIHGNLIALKGFSNSSTAYIVDKTKLFKLRTKDLSDLDTIANLDLSRLSSKGLQKPNLVNTPIPATIVLPPFITAKIIAKQAFSNAQHCFNVVWDLLITRDEAEGITTFFPQDDNDVSNIDENKPHINELTDDPLQSPRTPTTAKSVNPQSNLQRFEPLLLFLFAAADTHYGRSLKSSFQPNTDDDIEQWRKDRDDSVTTTKKQATQK
jgi:hypothetical protein